jgi:hypothetical protein
MKRALWTLLAVVVAVGLSGCCGGGLCLPKLFGGCSDCAVAQPATCADGSCSTGGGVVACDQCGGRGCGLCGREAITPGPPSAAVAYPYYTTRGPRDFLAANPRSIGP